jgi:hypothetical protein
MTSSHEVIAADVIGDMAYLLGCWVVFAEVGNEGVEDR